MSKPSWDAAELARSALSELTEHERADLMAQEFGKISDLQALCEARNVLTERASEIIADRYADHLLGECGGDRGGISALMSAISAIQTIARLL